MLRERVIILGHRVVVVVVIAKTTSGSNNSFSVGDFLLKRRTTRVVFSFDFNGRSDVAMDRQLVSVVLFIVLLLHLHLLFFRFIITSGSREMIATLQQIFLAHENSILVVRLRRRRRV